METNRSYTEALERANVIYNGTYKPEIAAFCRQSLERIFPELRESADEKIRKWLIAQLKMRIGNNATFNNMIYKAIPWLEKHGNTDVEQVFRPLTGCDIDTAAGQAVEQQNQGKNVVLAFNGCYIPVENKTANAIVEEYYAWLEKQSDKASYESAEKEKQEFVDAGFIKCYTDFQDFKEGKTYWLEYIGNDNYNVRSDNLLGKTYHITPCQLYTIFKKQPWSEAQDELTPNPYSGVSFNDNGNVWGMCARDNGVDILFNGKLIQHISSETQDEAKPGEQTTVCTPSFNVDDFIANEYCAGKVVELTNDAYLLDTGQSIPFSCHSTHLWSIKDAKEGDVLVNWNNTAFIFKAIEDETVKFHIVYNEKWDAIKTPSTKLSHLGLPEPQFEFHPATKEQRDTLMKAMADAGYEWNAEKKKLQKIKKQNGKFKPMFKVKYNGNEYNVVDMRSSVGIIFYGIEDEPNHIDYVQAQNCEEVDDYVIKENGSPYPTKHAVFSEQTPANEEKPAFDPDALIEESYQQQADDIIDMVTEKPAWSEEDEWCYNSIIEHLKYSITNGKPETYKSGRLTDWLKSFKDRVKSQAKQ